MFMKLILVVTVIFVLLIVGTMDYNDNEREAATYCKLVADGTWPAYRAIDCPQVVK